MTLRHLASNNKFLRHFENLVKEQNTSFMASLTNSRWINGQLNWHFGMIIRIKTCSICFLNFLALDIWRGYRNQVIFRVAMSNVSATVHVMENFLWWISIMQKFPYFFFISHHESVKIDIFLSYFQIRSCKLIHFFM